MSKIIKIFLMIISYFLIVFLLIAIFLYLSGVRGAIGISPEFRSYIAKVVNATGQSSIMKINSVNTLPVSNPGNFFEFILNVGKVIVNMFIGVINIFVWLWNTQVTIITFIVNLVRMWLELHPSLFYIDDNAWWWHEIGHTSRSI